jgi:mono/diheme cytochrome c family protein
VHHTARRAKNPLPGHSQPRLAKRDDDQRRPSRNRVHGRVRRFGALYRRENRRNLCQRGSAHAPDRTLGGAAISNPLPASKENLLAGIKLYAQDCAICHGAASGESSDVAKGLYQDPPQFHREGVEDDPAGIVYWKIAHGLRWTGMPAFAKTLSEKQLWQLTLFLQKMDRLPPLAQHAWRQVHVAAATER